MEATCLDGSDDSSSNFVRLRGRRGLVTARDAATHAGGRLKSVTMTDGFQVYPINICPYISFQCPPQIWYM